MTYAPCQVVGGSWSSELCHCLASPHHYCTLHLLLGERAGRGGEGEGWGGGGGEEKRRRGGVKGGEREEEREAVPGLPHLHHERMEKN